MKHLQLFEAFNEGKAESDTDGFIELTPAVRKERYIQWESNDPSYYWKKGRIELFYDVKDKYIGINVDGVDFCQVEDVDSDAEANRIGKMLMGPGEFSFKFKTLKDRDNMIEFAKKQGIKMVKA